MPEPPSGEDPDGGAPVSSVTITSRRAPQSLLPFALRRADQGGAPRRAGTPLGTLASGVVAELDPAGAIQLRGRRWHLDWWVGAQDRWHHPSAEAAVRQTPIDASPAMRTTLRVPGGDIVQRVVVAVGRIEGGERAGVEGVVVEIENGSPVPVALALVLRPWDLDGPGSLRSVELDGTVVRADGVVSLVLPRPPARVAHGRAGAPAVRLARGDDEAPTGELSGDGDLEAALVFPLAHGATLRVVLPLVAPVARGRSSPDLSRLVTPSVASVLKGWTVHGRRDPTAVMPVADWGSLLAWSGAILRIAGPEEITRAMDRSAVHPRGGDGGRRTCATAEALSTLEAPELHDAVAAALCEVQRRSGRVEMADGGDATAGLLFVAGATLLGPRRDARSDELLGPVANAMRYLSRRRDAVLWTQARREASALLRLAPALASVGQPDLADEALRSAAVGLEPRSWESAAPRVGPSASDGGRSSFELAADLHAALLGGRASASDELSRHLARRGTAGCGDVLDDRGAAGGEVRFDGAELAELRLALLDLQVCDGPGGPLLFTGWRPSWAGLDLECHGVVTAWGRVSAALRWHGRRPAVLWEVDPVLGAVGSAVPEVRAPSLDPSWRGEGWAGEALLAQLAAGRT
jgi:hypothetical protein